MKVSLNRNLQLALLILLLVISVLNTFLSVSVGLLNSQRVQPPDYRLGAGPFLSAALFMAVSAGLMWALFRLQRQEVRS